MHVKDLDGALAAPARLAVLASLYPGIPLRFTDLKAATGIADGNLHVQTRRLADAGYLTISKRSAGARTETSFRITEEGTLNLRLYVQRLLAIIEPQRSVILPQPPREGRDASRVW